jgi:Uma2 family endonuclease
MSTISGRATLDDLYLTPEKAELIGGKVVTYMSTGVRPSEVASNIYVSLRDYAGQSGRGKAFNDNLGYAVPELPSGRESFAPDASYYDGPLPSNRMRFIEGPPTFAVEVRSQGDYGAEAELDQAAKRDDYFQAGTKVVWDVDPIAETVTKYQANSEPIVYGRGLIADAEPAVPGWRIPVEIVFA